MLIFMVLVAAQVMATSDDCGSDKELTFPVETTQIWCCPNRKAEVSFQLQALFQSSQADAIYSFFIGHGVSDCIAASETWTLAWEGHYKGNQNQSVYVLVPLFEHPELHQNFSIIYGYKNGNPKADDSVDIVQWYVLVDEDSA